MKTHFLGLDALRGVAAVCVVLLHFQSYYSNIIWLPHAYLAVDFFFMLSGFVLAYSYEQKFAVGMTLSMFMKLRLVRLYPLMFAGVVAGTIYVVLQGLLVPQHAMPPSATLIAIILGLLLFSNDLNGASWSILFELLVNAFYRLLGKHVRDRWLWLIIVLFGADLACLAYFSDWLGNQDLGFPSVIEFVARSARAGFCFFFGVGLYRWFARHHFPASLVGHPFFTSLGLVTIFCAPDGWSDFYNLVVTVLIFPLIILASAAYQPAGLSAPMSKFSGWISFPLYAIHMPVGALAAGAMTHFHIYSRLPPLARTSVILIVVIPIACILERYYDEPIRKWLTRKPTERLP